MKRQKMNAEASNNKIKIQFLQQISYQFPVDLLKLSNIKGKKQFKQLMQAEAQGNQFNHHWKIDQKKLGSIFRIYVQCLKCKANIKYHQNPDSTWTLINFNTHHVHLISQVTNDKIIKKQQKFDQFLMSDKFKNDHNINTKKLNQKNQNFEYIKNLLKYLRYDFKYEYHSENLEKQGYPETLIAVSQDQKINYRNYGQSVSYDITYNCIKELSYDNKKFGVGIFSGFDNNNRVLIFGFSITTIETIYNFKNIFASFFDLMGFTNTTAIITDQQPSIISALKQLKLEQNYKYHHIYDNWHFIRSFRQALRLKDEEIITELTTKLAKTMRQTDPKVGLSYLINLKDTMKNNYSQVYNKIEKKLDHVCIWKMPKRFIGLSVHSNECINDLLKMKVQYQTTLYQLIQKFDKVSKQRIKKCKSIKKLENYPFEVLFRDQRIEQIRKKFEKKVFDVFIYNYRRSQFYFIKNDHQRNKYQIQHKIDGDQYTIVDYHCQCGATQKIGIPCQHLLYLKRQKYPKQSYVRLFNERWLIQDEKKEKLKKVGMKQIIQKKQKSIQQQISMEEEDSN